MIVSIKAVTLTHKIAKQLEVIRALSKVEYNLLKTGYKFTGILELDNQFYVLASHKSDPVNKLIDTTYFTEKFWLEVIGHNTPHNLHRIVLT
jgi:hypothetical protein